MKRLAMLATVCCMALVVASLFTGSVEARPEYKSRLDEATKNSKAADAIKEQKCNVCHYGKVKKNRNEFGKAVGKGIDGDKYKSMKEDKEKLNQAIDAALKAAMKEKSSGGKTFGELIEAGELPAKNPE